MFIDGKAVGLYEYFGYDDAGYMSDPWVFTKVGNQRDFVLSYATADSP